MDEPSRRDRDVNPFPVATLPPRLIFLPFPHHTLFCPRKISSPFPPLSSYSKYLLDLWFWKTWRNMDVLQDLFQDCKLFMLGARSEQRTECACRAPSDTWLAAKMATCRRCHGRVQHGPELHDAETYSSSLRGASSYW